MMNNALCMNRYQYYRIIQMEFLKKNLDLLVTKILPAKDQDPHYLIKSLLSSTNSSVDEKTIQRLATLSHDAYNYRVILNQLTKALQGFSFSLKAERVVAKALTVATYLVKMGNDSFLDDLRKCRQVLGPLEEVDVHHFETKHPWEKKELEYELQLIKQRAFFLKRLLEDDRLLEAQRRKMPRCSEIQESQADSCTGHSLVTSLQSSNRNIVPKFSGVNPSSIIDEQPFNLADILDPK